MNTLKKGLFQYHKHVTSCIKWDNSSYLALYSTKIKVVTQQQEQEYLQTKIQDTDKIALFRAKAKAKKPQKPPFAKNLFLGEFDVDILTYPQLDKEEWDVLNSNLQPVIELFKTPEIIETTSVTREFAEKLHKASLFGLRMPQSYGGRQLSVSESCRFNEVISEHNLKRTLIYNDQFSIQALLKNGSGELKNKYLPSLISGSVLSAFCMSEPNTSDPRYLSTKAVRSHDGTWVLNGEKSWIINGNTADVFLVLAETHAVKRHDIVEAYITAFLVEKKFDGITVNKCSTSTDMDIANVVFKDTCVPSQNIVGTLNSGHVVLSSILTELRLSAGPMCQILTKKLLNNFADYCRNTVSGTVNLFETDSVLSKIGELLTTIYAMESATYLTAGLLDQYENQDCELEAAIVKVFCSEQSVLSSLLCLDFLGTPAYVTSHWCNKIHRDALGYSLLNENNDSLRLMIALMGIQYAGVKLNEHVRKSRNPMFHPLTAWKNMWKQRKQIEDRPKLTLGLNHYLHPSAEIAAECLEYCVLRLQFATETLLVRHGAEIVNDHMNLRRLADCIIDIYMMTASIGRASRSYCIGLQHSEAEIITATIFCTKARERVKANVNAIWDGKYNTGDQNYKFIAETVGKFGGYYPVHPLSRNF